MRLHEAIERAKEIKGSEIRNEFLLIETRFSGKYIEEIYEKGHSVFSCEQVLSDRWKVVMPKKELSREDLARAWDEVLQDEKICPAKAENSMSFQEFCKQLGL